MSARKGWRVLVTVGVELPDSQPRFVGGDEHYSTDEYVRVLKFSASRDRVAREVEKALKQAGFKIRGSYNSTLNAPDVD